jgi:hypothetical protein
MGIFMGVLTGLAVLLILRWVIYITAPVSNIHDDTDPENAYSGLNLYTDNLTGVQYLSVGNGLTPRLNADGSIHNIFRGV